MTIKQIFILVLMSVPILSTCSLENMNEIVMSPGMIIKAKNTSGTITIEAGKGLKRIYRWDDNSITVKMWSRDARWDGSLGIYSPGGEEDIHAVVEEGQQHFCSEQEAIEWLTWQNDRMHYVYTPDGLVVGFEKETTKDTNAPKIILHVDVWQFYILGKKPVNLPGASKDAVEVTFKEGASVKQIRIGNFQPSSPQKINGRLYSGKSIDVMKEKGITSDRVEKLIIEGEHKQLGNYLFYYIKGGREMLWLFVEKQQRIVLLGN